VNCASRIAGHTLRLGELVYTYRFDARSNFFDAEVELELDPGRTVEDVILTIGHDDITQPDYLTRYTTLYVDHPDAPVGSFLAGEPGNVLLPASGAPYWSMVEQGEMRGFALAVHSIP
jgi:hypothetical protein